MYMNTR